MKEMKIFLTRNVILKGGKDGFVNSIKTVGEDDGKDLIRMKKAEPYDSKKHDKLIRAAGKATAKTE